MISKGLSDSGGVSRNSGCNPVLSLTRHHHYASEASSDAKSTNIADMTMSIDETSNNHWVSTAKYITMKLQQHEHRKHCFPNGLHSVD